MPQHHCCTVCRRNDVKLYRWGGEFLREERIYCAVHKPTGKNAQMCLVPLIEDLNGMVWGVSSAPDDDIARFNALPDE